MNQQEVAQAVLASLQQTGFKQPVWIKLNDGSAFQGIITGLNAINNAMFVQAIDIGTDQRKSVAMTKISEISTRP
jgi:hypothetical protein